MLHTNITVNEKNHLCFGGADTVELANKYKTPLYLLDEERVREKCRTFAQAFKKYFKEGSMALVASKALSLKAVYKIAQEEGLGADSVSGGEIYAAKESGFELKNMVFHGNAKSREELSYAIDENIGYIAVDNLTELERISKIAGEKGKVQNIILRLTPGIDPHTFDAVNTGKVDSKFGFPIETGAAEEAVVKSLEAKNVKLCGYHCHIGSQIFDYTPFKDAADIMLEFIKDMKDKTGYEAEVLNLGGGFGVRYLESDPDIDIEETIKKTADFIENKVKELNINYPTIFMEPGRSIVADAGMTLYTVENVKIIPDYKNFVSIDGGMSDNPRFALYQSPYTVYLASRANDKADFKCTVAGKCCESGDLIQEDVLLPKPEADEILAVSVTGAYNYSMSSIYNYNLRPPVVAINKGKDRLIVKRQSLESIMENQL